jgi:hypothetical protein
MDSKTVNKLIRSEIWPILRQFEFSHFDERNAFSYRGKFINVVNFQSFNSYHASALGCTTFSFSVNLGTYIVGNPGAQYVRQDATGRLMPYESQCPFRSRLRKRTPVDGFSRDELFFIDSEGRSAGPCFEELRYLVSNCLPGWFNEHNDLDSLIAQMDAVDETGERIEIDTSGNPGSYSWNSLKSVLLLLKHKTSQTPQSAARLKASLDQTIGTILNFSTIQSGRISEEQYASNMRELWPQEECFRPAMGCVEGTSNEVNCIESPIWSAVGNDSVLQSQPPNSEPAASSRKDLWPILKRAGFSEFTDRLAHRISDQTVEVVEFLPMDPFERKERNHPPGLFRLGMGVFWPPLAEDGLYRRGKKGLPRPKADECHVSNWMAPRLRTDQWARTAFHSATDAIQSLTQPGLRWLDMLKDPAQTLTLLQCADWELFWFYPMMRGYGASGSSRRLAYLSLLCKLLGRRDESLDYFRQAELAVDSSYMENLRPHYRDWISSIRERLNL